MAIYPCDVGNHSHARKNIHVYASFVTRDGDLRSRLRLCDLHWRAVQPDLAKHEVFEDGGLASDHGMGTPCPTCGEVLQEPLAQLFVTAYPSKDDRKDYWLRVHEACGSPSWLPWKEQEALKA